MRPESGSSVSLLNGALVAVLAALAALHWGLGRDSQARGLELFPNMAHAVPAEAFSANPALPDGMTLQPPAEGAIARGWLPIHLAATPADASRAGETLANPFSLAEPAAVARGQSVFARYCVLCHGPAGTGDGTVTQRGFPAPPSLLAPNARQIRDGQIFHIVTFGQGNMPGHAAQLDRADRWRAALWVRELQRQARPTDEPAPAPRAASQRPIETPGAVAASGGTDAERTDLGDTP